RQWYNGYKWLGEGVYNPFDILLFIDNNFEYKNYWFTTATPTFLLKVLEQNNYYLPNFENIVADTMLLDSFDVEDIRIETLMWQTGYLTIDHTETILDNIEYHLKLPNKEVEQSLLGAIATHITKNPHKVQQSNMMLKAMLHENMKKFETSLKALFASIGYNNFTNSRLYKYEGYYVSVFYTYLKALGIKLTAEDITNKGRIDLTVELPNAIFVIEFKVDGEGALEQIEQMGYHEKYLDTDKPIYLVGIEFDSKERNIAALRSKKIV
ncbi:MAG: PD-(D/E)XK nuclease domain-containing protein, partial [Campylobacterota bacterium]